MNRRHMLFASTPESAAIVASLSKADRRKNESDAMQSHNSCRQTTALPRERQGFALLAVMICLIAVSVLMVSWFKAAAFERQQVRAAERRLQANWLAEA